MSIDEFDGNPFGPGYDYRVPPTDYIPGEIYITLGADEAPPGSYVYDQSGRLIGIVPVATPPAVPFFDGPPAAQMPPPFDPGPGLDDNTAGITPPPSPDWTLPPQGGVYLPPSTTPTFPPPVSPGVIVPLPNPVTSVGNPSLPIEGGPEDRPPPRDFDEPVDIPLPSEAPPGNVPAVRPPDIEGELVGPDVIYHDYEGYDELPGGDYGPAPRRIIEGETEQPPWWLGPAARRVGRVILGPYGSVIGQVIEAGMPEILGRGDLPFPPIPPVDIQLPEPEIQWPEYDFPEPEQPELARPPVPEVIVVTPNATLPQVGPLPTATPLPTSTGSPLPWWLLVSQIILGRSTRPRPAPIPRPSESLFGQVEPIAPNSPPQVIDPLTPPLPRIGTDPLTPPEATVLPLPLPSGLGAQFVPPVQTDTDQDRRCRCRKCKEDRKKKPSSTVARVKRDFDRRMSRNSLRNLKRGKLSPRRLKL